MCCFFKFTNHQNSFHPRKVRLSGTSSFFTLYNCLRFLNLLFFIHCVLGAFELAIIRMSRYFDTSQNAVLFMNHMLPMGAFTENRDTIEMKLVSQIFDFAKSLAEMELTDVALSLFSAYILLQEGKISLIHKPRKMAFIPIFYFQFKTDKI